MRTFKVVLKTVDGTHRWVERVEGFDDRDIKCTVYIRYGLRVEVIKAEVI